MILFQLICVFGKEALLLAFAMLDAFGVCVYLNECA